MLNDFFISFYKKHIKEYKLFVIFSGASVLLSILLTISILRVCSLFSDHGYASLLYFMCGGSSASQSSFRKVTKADLSSVESMVNESKEFSIDRGLGASNLIDGSVSTLAAPASNKIDYRVNLVGNYKIKQIIVHWGDYGVNKNYINKWSLELSGDGVNWFIIESGGSPGSDRTVINKRFSAAFLRLKAEAENDWIGVNELDIIGVPSTE